MISAQLMGGLGNQLFIYSFCKILSYKVKQDVLLYFDSEDGRELEINKFKLAPGITVVKAPFLSRMESIPKTYMIWRKIIEHLPRGKLRDLIIKLSNRAGVVFVPEGFSELDYQALGKCKNIIVNGFFQSEKYLKGYETEIKKDFLVENVADPDLSFRLRNEALQIQGENSVCVHIRRGDYLKPEYKDRFLVCNEDYYKRGIDFMKRTLGNINLYVFSDSIEWVKENFEFLGAYHPTYNGGELAVLEDFAMMKACRHFVMSNSTLSWWVQYLSDSTNKVVVAPDRWLNDHNEYTELYSDDWHLINV